MKILLILILAYAVFDVFSSTVNIDLYKDLKQASPYEHCVAAFSDTPNISQCGEIRLTEDK